MGKKKRLQPRPKKKKVVFVSKQDKLNLMKKDNSFNKENCNLILITNSYNLMIKIDITLHFMKVNVAKVH